MSAPRRHAAAVLSGSTWALAPAGVRRLETLARTLEPAALTAWADAPVPRTALATVVDGIATVAITGPLTRTRSFWSWLFGGGGTYEQIAVDLEKLRADPAIAGILLEFDSPGGEVAGAHELATLIADLREAKPLVAHVAAEAASAAYWLAAATETIVADETAIVGSIGTMATFVDSSGFDEELGFETIEIVSTQSPKKLVDPTVPEGRRRIEQILTDLAAVFIRDVALHRGVSEDVVLQTYGQGDVLVGQAARDAGMVDALGTRATALATVRTLIEARADAVRASVLFPFTPLSQETRMRAHRSTGRNGALAAPGARASAAAAVADPPTDPPPARAEDDLDDDEIEDDETEAPAALRLVFPKATAAIATAAATAERERILALEDCAAKVKTPRADALLATAKRDPATTPATFALQLVDGGAFAAAQTLAGLDADAAALIAPDASAGGGTSLSPDEALVQTIVATHARFNPRRT